LTLKENLLSLNGLDHAGRIPILLEIVSLIEKHESLLENVLVAESYIYAAYNAGLLGVHFGDEEVFKRSVSHLKGFATKHDNAETLVFERNAILHLSRDLALSDFVNAASTVANALNGLNKYGKRLSPKFHVDLILEIALYYFKTVKWSEIVKLMPRLINEPPMVTNPKAVVMSWLLFVVAQYELGNMDTMASYVGYAKKYLKKYGMESEIGKILLSALGRIANQLKESERRAEFLRFKAEVLPILNEKENLYFVSRLPFASWITSNLSKLSSEGI
jgi:hypothetical protein